MKYMILISALLAACAKKADPDAPVVHKTSVANEWSAHEPWVTVDLSQMSFTNSFQVTWHEALGEICQSTATAIGDASAGTMTFTGGLDVVRDPTSQPACSRHDGAWTYQFVLGSLELCQAGKPCFYLD